MFIVSDVKLLLNYSRQNFHCSLNSIESLESLEINSFYETFQVTFAFEKFGNHFNLADLDLIERFQKDIAMYVNV